MAKAAPNDPVHTANTACAATDLSHVTDRQTDTANIGKNSLHLMHSMKTNNNNDEFVPIAVETLSTMNDSDRVLLGARSQGASGQR